ncbi:DUF748 domain-containing protein [Algiphilus sp.]|uniref:DUF748 domain-containing protein n=1 Tax=Algiphilus sp. TaxID=1872431 RepID=UPI0032EAC898
MKRRYRIAAGIVVLAMLVRAAAPALLERQINDRLAALDHYTGRVGDVDLHLWRGAYSIEDVHIHKHRDAPDRPLFAADRLQFSLRPGPDAVTDWVTEVALRRPQVNFIDGAGDRDQAGRGANWLRLFDRLAPLPIDRIAVQEGAVHFYNFAGAHVYLAQLDGAVTALSRSPSPAAPLPARLEMTAQAMDSAPAELKADLAPRVQPPAFALQFRMQQLDLADFRLLAKSYAPFDINAGRMDFVMELHARNGTVDGYAKPLLKDVEILSIDVDVRQDKDHPLRLMTEATAALIAELLENRSSDRIATRIPIEGKLDALQRDWLTALWGVLANAFLEGLNSNFDDAPPPASKAGANSATHPVRPGPR